MRLYLGNRDAVEHVQAGDGPQLVAVPGKQCTRVDFPDGTSTAEAFVTVTAADGVWANHAAAGATPAWVACQDTVLAGLLAEHFGGIEIRDVEA